jgi:hypothetical protein
MTDVDIIEKHIAQMTDRLDRATARLEAIAQERQALGYDLHVNNSKEAELRATTIARDERAVVFVLVLMVAVQAKPVRDSPRQREQQAR